MSDELMSRHFDTQLIHAGERIDAGAWKPTSTPIYASATFTYETAEELDAAFDVPDEQFVYSRFGNPTVGALEAAVAAIERGHGAVACSSGMAALHIALLAAMTPRGSEAPQPRHILASRHLYGATYTLLQDFLSAQGASVTYCEITDLAAIDQAIARRRPDVLILESIANPLLQVANIGAIAERARAVDARLVVDATMSTPVLHQPIVSGADIVVHSATKFLGGHGDVVGGVMTLRTPLMLEVARRYARLLGVTLGPFEAMLIARGIKTLGLRLRRQSANALEVAGWLSSHPRVERVIYPGLADHPQHSVAAREFDGLYGAMLTFELRDAGRPECFAIIDRLKLIRPATSLGDIYTLISYPPMSSHRGLSAERRRELGISDGMLRLSIGIEDARDIIADLEQALH